MLAHEDRARSSPPTTALVSASTASVAGDPISGITKNGSTNVATIEPVVLTASSEPLAEPSVPASSPSSDAVAGKVMPIAMVGGSTTTAADQANVRSASRKSGAEPLNGFTGDARTAAPATTRIAVATWAAPISAGATLRFGRSRPSTTAPVAMPTRNSARMIVNTYVELPVPAPSIRFQTTW